MAKHVEIPSACFLFREALGEERVPYCCSTCHTDNEEYGYAMNFIEFEHGGVVYDIEVCCGVDSGNYTADELMAVIEHYLRRRR